MNNPILINILRFIALFLAQVFIFNHINIVGYINPFMFLMFLVLLPFETPWWLLLFSSFGLGLLIDVFTGSIGVHAMATTAAAFARPTLIQMLLPKLDRNTTVYPGIRFLGIPTFALYTAIIVSIHHLLFFFVETLHFYEFFYVLLRTILSVIFTTILIVLLDYIFLKKK